MMKPFNNLTITTLTSSLFVIPILFPVYRLIRRQDVSDENRPGVASDFNLCFSGGEQAVTNFGADTSFYIAGLGDFISRFSQSDSKGKSLTHLILIVIDPGKFNPGLARFKLSVNIFPVGQCSGGTAIDIAKIDDIYSEELYENHEVFCKLRSTRQHLNIISNFDVCHCQCHNWAYALYNT